MDASSFQAVVLGVTAVATVSAAISAILAWYSTRQYTRTVAAIMYRDTNKWISEEGIAPLTPYGINRGINPKLLAHLLDRFNRFRFLRQEKELHIAFRKRTMGDSLTEFRERVIENGGDQKLADDSVRALCLIKKIEPYLTDEFWDCYFNGFSWTKPEKDRKGEV